MFALSESPASLRRLKVLNNILNSSGSSLQKLYSTESYVKIGNTLKEIKNEIISPGKMPRMYLKLYGGVLKESQTYLKYLKWLIQKDQLRQDAFLIGYPPGAFRRNLAFAYAELTKREVEYLCLSRDTTEADIKQRREIVSGNVIYNNQCAVNAALNGRILIIEGIEKAERNLLPILNNLLENREMNLDNGQFLVAPERYDKLVKIASKNGSDMEKLNLLRVHPDFRVIALGLPVPKYKGNPLDPPLRSRFQAHLVNYPQYDDYFKYIQATYSNVDVNLIGKLLDFAYSFYDEEIQKFNLPDFPIENLDKIFSIVDSVGIENVNLGRLVYKLYPHKLLLKNDEANIRLLMTMYKKFNILFESNEIEFQLIEVMNLADDKKNVKFNKSSIDVIKGNCSSKSDFVMNAYHSSVIVDMCLSHSTNADFCLVGNRGCGKTALINQFASMLDYNVKTIHLYKDMSARDLIQQRITLSSGDTKWNSSLLMDACTQGSILVLDGIHRIRDDTLLSIRRLIQDRELDLLDGRKLLRHDKYDEIVKEHGSNPHIVRIHPSFCIIATAEPPTNSDKNQWLTSEILNLFLFHEIQPLSENYQHEILAKKYKLNEQHERLFEFVRNLNHDAQLKQVAKLFSLRQLIRLSHKLEKYENLSLRELVENSSLYKFMPQLNKELFNEFMLKNNLHSLKVPHEQISFDSFNNNETNKSIDDLAKIPDTLFYENRIHTIILNNLKRDFQLGEHLLLIGNQGTGKNKLVDKFLMSLKRPREYVQLHRDTTVHTLTVQPNIKNGIIEYEDSPLVKAVKNGNIIVIDEADKAPVHVISVLKSLIESGEMSLSDGRHIVPFNSLTSNVPHLIRTHRDFRIIILANRPGFPFLGNDFFSILGDLLSCHPIDNPDPQSEIQMLKMYAPSVDEKTLQKLINAFGSLRELSDQNLIAYPFSTRELVNLVRHLEKYPHDSLSNVIGNISDFDFFNEQNDLKSTFTQIMNKHGIPVGASKFSVKLAQTKPLPQILPVVPHICVEKISNTSLKFNQMQLKWKELGRVNANNNETSDRFDARTNSFSELRSTWNLPLKKSNLITDLCVSVKNIFISSIKPLSVSKFDLNTNKLETLDISDYLPLAWRTYYPRLKLHSSTGNCVYVHEESTNMLFKLDFYDCSISELNKINFTASNLVKKTIDKFFSDQNHTFKMINLVTTKNDHSSCFVSYKKNTSTIDLLNFDKNYQLSIDLPFKINHVTQARPNLIILSSLNSNLVQGNFILTIPVEFFELKQGFTDGIELEKIENILESNDDFILNSLKIRNVEASREDNTIYLPSIYNHFIKLPCKSSNDHTQSYFCRRNTPIEHNTSRRNTQSPILQSLVDCKTDQIITQIPLYAKPKNFELDSNFTCGYLEIINLKEKTLSYLEVPKQVQESEENKFKSMNMSNEADFFLDSNKENYYTLDLNGCLREWEFSKLNLEKSLDDWHKMLNINEEKLLSLEIVSAQTSNDKLKDLNGPKHGKVDSTNAPHVGGNTWAGGSGGRDTAGLGGVGGPYRLDSGNQVYQVSDEQKAIVPEHIKRAAREMSEKTFRERLREINMSEYDHNLYSKYLQNVKKPIQQLRNILGSLEAKKKERQWLKHQTSGDLDDGKLVEMITGDKDVYKKRGEDENAQNELNMEKPKRLKLLVDVSGSMYRFNGVDNRLERELESVLMVMEAFNEFESKIRYDIVGHSGDGFDFKFVDSQFPPKNEAERLKLLKTMIAHSQFCSSGDYTLEATKYCINQLAQEDADDHFLLVLSDANFDRYGISPKSFANVMQSNAKVNVYCIFIGSLGNQAASLKSQLPSGKTFICMNTQDIPKIMQQIFQSAILK